MRCNICGNGMQQVGRSRETGYPLWKCRQKHRTCPVCSHVLITKFNPPFCPFCAKEISKEATTQ